MAKREPKIAQYDLYGYDYEQYWGQGRNYENESDKIAIKKLLQNESGDWFVDLGGSYGRLVPLYRTKFLHCILTDYSIGALKKAKKNLKDRRIQNVELVAANIYNLPFKNNTLDAGLMVRVMHHLESPKDALKEISRITQNIFILEFANKIHFLARLRAIIKLNFKFLFSKEPYKQPSRETRQGTGEDEGLFYNFHPSQISKTAKENSFEIIKHLSVSNFRSGFIKRLVSIGLLLKLESLLQKPLSLISFGPSQYLKLKKRGEGKTRSARNLMEIICCPKCKSNITKKGSSIVCTSCKEDFPVTHGIYDLRWPKPS